MNSKSKTIISVSALVIGAAVAIGAAKMHGHDTDPISGSSVLRKSSLIAHAEALGDAKASGPRAHKASVSDSNWDREFYSTDNLLPLVKRAASAAIYNKDGRAAYLVSQALGACAGVIRKAQLNPDFENTFDDEYAKMAPNATEWIRQKARRDFDRCAALAKADAFSDLPPRPDGYRQSSFWQTMALDNGDPLAEVHQARLDISDAKYGAQDGRGAVVEMAQQYIIDATRSGDPAALFTAGQILSNSQNSSDPLRGVAISLAACELGYDCSSKNPANVFAVCAVSGACPPDADFAYYMQQSLGAEAYATAYANAQTLKDLIVHSDWDGVASYTILDGSLTAKN